MNPGNQGPEAGQDRPYNYTIPAVCTCLFCFCPLGACALYNARQAQSLYDDGDIAGANSASKKAKMCLIASIIIGILIVLAGLSYVVFLLILPGVRIKF